MTAQPSRGVRVLRVLRRAVAAVGALAVLAYLGVNATAWFSAHRNKNAAAERLAEMNATYLGALKEKYAATADALGAGEHRWLVMRCEVVTSDSGWIVQSYAQRCWLEASHTYAVTDIDDARHRIAGAPVDVVGASGQAPSGRGCTALAATMSGTPYSIGTTQTTSTFVPAETPDEDYWCGKSFGPNSYQHEAVYDGDHQPLANDRNWLVVSHSVELGRDDIGCARWSILFCSRPSGIPVLPARPS